MGGGAKTKKLGVVFDRHLPGFVPIPTARPRRGDLVAKKGRYLTDLWRARRVNGRAVHCVPPERTPGADHSRPIRDNSRGL